MAPELQKNDVVDDRFTVRFYVCGDHLSQRYRVTDSLGSTAFLIIYTSAKLTRNDFIGDALLMTKILSLFDHDKIIKLIDSGEFAKNGKKFHYIVTNFISGETLQEKLQRDGTFSQYEAVTIAIDILEALSELHAQPDAIIHNNINPSTIMLDYSSTIEKAVLTSFAYARYITSKSHSVELDGLSPFYIAPELYNGTFTPQSDVFSVGALLYQLIFGIPPWYIEIPKFQHTQEKQMDAIAQQRQKKLTFGLMPDDDTIDENLKQTLRSALASNVDDRFANAQDFLTCLRGGKIPSLAGTQPADNNSKQSEKTNTLKKTGGGFAAIAGMQELKDILKNDVIRAVNEAELYREYGLAILNGILLYGPPGCGKTFIAERFSEEVDFNFVQLKPSDMKSKWINDTELKIAAIFKQAVDNAPSILFIDEFDAVAPTREGDLNHMHAGAVNELLTQMSNCSERGVFVIAATNRPDKIDIAGLRRGRIDRIVYLPPPDYDARRLMFELYLKERPTDLGVDFSELASRTHNYVSSDIKFIVDQASRTALKTRGRITQKILEKTISDTRPSISQSELKKYEVLKEKLESR